MFDEQSDMIFDMVWHEDEWAELMRSEQNLSRLLTVVSIVATSAYNPYANSAGHS